MDLKGNGLSDGAIHSPRALHTVKYVDIKLRDNTQESIILFTVLLFVLYMTQNGHKGQAFYFRDNSLFFPLNVPQISKFIQNGLTPQFTFVFLSMTKVVRV